MYKIKKFLYKIHYERRTKPLRKNDDLFNYTLRELEKKGQLELSLHFQRQRMLEQYNQKKELERMKQEIVNEVLSRISIMFSTGEAMNKIKGLNEAIEQLTK